MKSIIALIRENRALSLAFFAVFLFCVGIYLYTRWDTARFEASLQTPPPVQEPPPETHSTEPQAPRAQLTQGGHWHGDEWHAEQENPYIPSPPENDPFWASIVFPETPGDGHPHPAPLERLPDVILNNPHLFQVDEYGFPSLIYSPETLWKIDSLQGSGLKGDAYSKKVAEILAEGLAPLLAAHVVMRHRGGGGARQVTKALLDQALAENPDDFDTLSAWCTWNRREKPAEAEAGYRRMVELRPESPLALYSFGRALVDSEDADPREAIPYLEKAYLLNPQRAAALFVLGRAYLGLQQFEKSLKYFQASQAFTGPTRATSLYMEAIQRHLSETEAQ